MHIVTGAAGFIASAMLKKLNDMGIDDIIIVDDLGDTEKWKNLQSATFQDYIQKDDFLKRIQRSKFASSVSSVIHMGACSSTTETNAEYLMQNNFVYTRELAQWAMAEDVRFIYASSAATYGDGNLGFSDDDKVTPTLKALNMYGYSKQLFDLWALRTGAADNIAGIKFFNVYGPNEYHKDDMRSVVIKAFEQISETGAVSLFKSHRGDYKDGEQKRDFIYIKDCIDVMAWLLENPQINGIYNLGTGQARTWNDLVTSVFKAMGKEVNINYIDMPEHLRAKYQYHTEAEVKKLRDAGYNTPFTSLEDGISDYVGNYLLGKDRYL